ncbi:MAG TPA: alpha/beta hydrolase, partial [Saprospiraceae bacterium]|nr:alpha/beta hydrolase [Saprospiraceae bacterium]
ALSVAMWLRDADSLVTLLPDSTETALRVNLMRGTLSDTMYQKAVASYFQHYVARQLLYSADLDSCFAQMGVDVYLHFGGLSDLTFNGTLRNYNITGRLGEIKVPTLILYGEYDEVLPYTAEYYSSLIPGSKTEMILNSGSMISVDNAVDQNKSISDFLDSLEVKK